MVFDIVSRDDENLLKVCDVWKDMKDLESHHSHNIILKDGVYKWEQTNFDYGDLNRVMVTFYNNGLNKNSEEVRAFYRSIGYSLFGYWELVYWDVNNPIIMDYKQPDFTIEGYTVWGDKTIVNDSSDFLNAFVAHKTIETITSNLKHIIKPYKVVLCHYPTMITDDIKEWFSNKGIDIIDDNIARHNPLLVECVEYLLEDNPKYYKDSYEIVKIKGSQYFIQNDSRYEWVLEPDDIEWIDIEKGNHVE